MRARKGWEPYPIGTLHGGALIVEQVRESSTASDHLYFVHWQCCGGHGTQTHAQLSKRERNERVVCWTCSRKVRQGVPRGKDQSLSDEPEPLVIDIQPLGLSGRWMLLGKLGPRWGRRGADQGV